MLLIKKSIYLYLYVNCLHNILKTKYLSSFDVFIIVVCSVQGVGLDVKDGLAGATPGWPYPSVYHPYDAAFAGYPFNG